MQSQAPNTTLPRELGKPLDPGTQVTRVRFSKDGNVLLAACHDGTVRRWDMTAREPAALAPLGGHNGWVSGIESTSEAVFSTDTWGRLTAWDSSAKDPRKLWSLESAHDGWIRAISATGPGSLIATCGKDGFVRLWEPKDGKRAGEFALGTDLFSLCFVPGGKSLLAGDLFGKIHEIELSSGKRTRSIEVKELYLLERIQDVGGVRCLLFAGDGQTLLAAGTEPRSGGFVQGTPLLFAIDFASGKRLSSYKGTNDNEGFITDLAWHPAGHVIATTSGQPGQGKLLFWKPGEAQPYFIGGKLPNCHSVAMNPAGTLLAVSSTNANSSGNGRVKTKDGEYAANTSPIQLWSSP
jgi:WD40 repeat protein